MDERQRHAAGGGGGSDGGLSRQLAAAKLLAKDSSRQLEMAQDELAVAQAEKTTLASQLSAASRDVAAAEGKLGAAQDRASRALQGQTQLVASYDRLLAAFSAKCASLRMGQESSALAHEQFREKLTVRSSYIPVPYGHGTCHANLMNLCFPYVCPEPVLAKRSSFIYKWLKKTVFTHRKGVRLVL